MGWGVCRLFRVRQVIGYQMKTRKDNQRISLLVIIITIIPYISSIFIVFQVLFKFFIYPVNSVILNLSCTLELPGKIKKITNDWTPPLENLT